MESSENNEVAPEGRGPLQTILLNSVIEIERGIDQRYSSRRPSREARMDALVYAASQIAYSRFGPFIHIDEEETEENDRTAREFEEAIAAARSDDWDPMRDALQRYARLAFHVSVGDEVMHEANPRYPSGEESQRTGDSFVNLINSL